MPEPVVNDVFRQGQVDHGLELAIRFEVPGRTHAATTVVAKVDHGVSHQLQRFADGAVFLLGSERPHVVVGVDARQALDELGQSVGRRPFRPIGFATIEH